MAGEGFTQRTVSVSRRQEGEGGEGHRGGAAGSWVEEVIRVLCFLGMITFNLPHIPLR